MRRTRAAGLSLLCGALGACTPNSTGPQCDTLPTSVATTRGDTVVTQSGLKYLELSGGTGVTALSCNTVDVEYTGRLASTGAVFAPTDSLSFTPGRHQLIPGFEQGVVGMRVGGTRRVIIPPELGYGAQAYGQIPGQSTLVFDLRLLRITP